MNHNQPIEVRLADMAGQENNNSEEYDLMMEASDTIRELRKEIDEIYADLIKCTKKYINEKYERLT